MSILGRSIVAIKGSYAAGHTREIFPHGAGRAFHGALHKAQFGVNHNLAAEKDFMEQEFFLISMWLRVAELNHYTDVLKTVQKDSSFFSGTGFRAFQSLAYASQRLNVNNGYQVGLFGVLLFTSMLTYAINLMVVFVSNDVKIKAPLMRLLGPEGSNDKAIDGVITFKIRAFRMYVAGMFAFFVSAICAMLRKPVVLAIPPVVILVLCASGIVFYGWNIRKRFDLPENQLTTGQVFFFHSKGAAGKAASVAPGSPSAVSSEPTQPPPTFKHPTSLQSFCVDCGARYKTPSQKFCACCGSECENLFRSKREELLKLEAAEEQAEREAIQGAKQRKSAPGKVELVVSTPQA